MRNQESPVRGSPKCRRPRREAGSHEGERHFAAIGRLDRFRLAAGLRPTNRAHPSTQAAKCPTCWSNRNYARPFVADHRAEVDGVRVLTRTDGEAAFERLEQLRDSRDEVSYQGWLGAIEQDGIAIPARLSDLNLVELTRPYSSSIPRGTAGWSVKIPLDELALPSATIREARAVVATSRCTPCSPNTSAHDGSTSRAADRVSRPSPGQLGGGRGPNRSRRPGRHASPCVRMDASVFVGCPASSAPCRPRDRRPGREARRGRDRRRDQHQGQAAWDRRARGVQAPGLVWAPAD